MTLKRQFIRAIRDKRMFANQQQAAEYFGLHRNTLQTIEYRTTCSPQTIELINKGLEKYKNDIVKVNEEDLGLVNASC